MTCSYMHTHTLPSRGIETTHPHFEGRARWGVDLVKSGYSNVDENGHGTHVAGTTWIVGPWMGIYDS